MSIELKILLPAKDFWTKSKIDGIGCLFLIVILLSSLMSAINRYLNEGGLFGFKKTSDKKGEHSLLWPPLAFHLTSLLKLGGDELSIYTNENKKVLLS